MPQPANLITDLDPSTAGINMQLGNDRVAVLTLDRPDCLNALDGAIFVRLTEELERIAADPGVRVLVVTGANGAFSAGADLNGIEWFAEHAEPPLSQAGFDDHSRETLAAFGSALERIEPRYFTLLPGRVSAPRHFALPSRAGCTHLDQQLLCALFDPIRDGRPRPSRFQSRVAPVVSVVCRQTVSTPCRPTLHPTRATGDADATPG